MANINMIKTGEQLRSRIYGAGFNVKDVQHQCGFGHPTAVYKWFAGNSLPTIDNLVIVSKMLKCNIDDLLVVDDEEQ